MLELLRTKERAVNELVSETGMSQSAVSKHLRVLRETDLVLCRIDGQRRLYRLAPEPLRQLDDWLSPYREMWTASLASLERHLDGVSRPRTARQGDNGVRNH